LFQKLAVSTHFRCHTCPNYWFRRYTGPVNLEQLPYWVSEISYLLLPRLETPDIPLAATALRESETAPPRYPVVALGGTFDHIHAGHKILLSMAAWIAERKIIVGVTGKNTNV
jgi:pantetheine-phosphate adenylyltransferase